MPRRNSLTWSVERSDPARATSDVRATPTRSPAPVQAATLSPWSPEVTFLGARYLRLARRIGKLKALVAIQHSILTAVWHVLSEDTDHHDLVGDCHAKLDPQRALRRLTCDANRLGYTVRFDTIDAA